MDEIYYVYVYLDPRKKGNYQFENVLFDYEPFYVGKGKKWRLNEHLTYSQLKRDRNKLKVNIIQSIMKDNLVPIIYKLYENLKEIESLELEEKLINLIGRRDLMNGTLSNLTNGGETNYCKFEDLNEETKNKLKKQRSIRMLNNNPMKKQEISDKVANKNRNKKHDDEYKKNMSESLKNSKKHKDATSSIEFRDIKKKEQEKNMIPVDQYDLNMNYINSYPSIKEASRQLKIPSEYISSVVNGRYKTTKNFIFKKC